jgi:hypothetical protein
VAVWLDLVQRLEAGLYADERLHAEATYRGESLPQWLSGPLEDVTHNADRRTPVLVLNVKGRQVSDSLCLLRLCDFERLAGVTLEAQA